jgi:hypothetical protein
VVTSVTCVAPGCGVPAGGEVGVTGTAVGTAALAVAGAAAAAGMAAARDAAFLSALRALSLAASIRWSAELPALTGCGCSRTTTGSLG